MRRHPTMFVAGRGTVIRAAELIERKRNGEELSDEEISELVLGYTRGDVPDYQMAAWCMAVYFKGLTGRETHALTDAMIRSGDTIDVGAALGRRVVDKHSTGGVGDKTSLAVGPIVAACGVPLGKMSRARARTHRGHARQARVDPGLPRRADDRGVPRAGARDRRRDHRPDGRPRPGGQEALRASRRHGDGGHRPAHRVLDHVEEARGRRRGDRPRRQGRRRRVHEDARRRAHPRRADGRPRPPRRARGRVPAHGHGSAARRRGRQRARGARGRRDDRRRGPARPHRAGPRRVRAPARALGSRDRRRRKAGNAPSGR